MLSLHNLSTKIPAIGPIDFNTNEHTVVVGPSGAGKTTLFRAILGLANCTGEITLDNRTLTRAGRALRFGPGRGMCMAWQDDRLLPHLTLRDNARLGAKPKEADDWMELLHISHLAGRFPHEISGGEAQRVNLVRAFASNCRLVLLDEPFHGVDIFTIRDLLSSILKKLSAQGRLVLMITHDISAVMGAFSKMLVLQEGKVTTHDSIESIYSNPQSHWLAQFLGEFSLLTKEDICYLTGETPGHNSNAFVRPEWLSIEAHHSVQSNATVLGATWRASINRIFIRFDWRDGPVSMEVASTSHYVQGDRIYVTLKKVAYPEWLHNEPISQRG